METAKEQAIEECRTELSEKLIKALENGYDEIMAYANMECPPPDKMVLKNEVKRRNAKKEP